ncbi:MAG: methyltransferase [Massilia sp.]
MSPVIHDPDALVALGRALQAAGYRFTTVTPATHERVNARLGNAWATDLRGVFGWSRPFRADLLAPELLALMARAGIVATDEGGGLRSTLRGSTLAGRLYFHSAWPPDGADAVFFGPDTYRFVAAIDRALGTLDTAPARAVDIGCGAGPGAVHLAQRFPRAEVVAADVNPAALALAGVNARLAGSRNVTPCNSDLLAGVTGDFDLVVANPPYVIDPEGRRYRDGGGAEGMALSLATLDAALGRLRPGGTLLLYTGVAIARDEDRLRDAIAARLDSRCAYWTYEELDPDVFGEELAHARYADSERIAVVCLLARQR